MERITWVVCQEVEAFGGSDARVPFEIPLATLDARPGICEAIPSTCLDVSVPP